MHARAIDDAAVSAHLDAELLLAANGDRDTGVAEGGDAPAADARVRVDAADDDASDATGSEIEWTTENWACCDRCDKWRRLPPGVAYCAEALPDQWFCEMNPNTQRNTCEKPEERMSRGEVWEEGNEVGEESEEGDEA